MIDEEHNRTDELTDAEYKAIASLSDVFPNITLEDIVRAEQILDCWRDAGKIVATMPSFAYNSANENFQNTGE